MNICQKCKTENDEESKFCNNCGSKIAINTNKINADNKGVISSLETNSLRKGMVKNNVKNSTFVRLKKYIFSLLLIICMTSYISAKLPIYASAETYDIYTYEISNGKAIITRCNGYGSVTIPNMIRGYYVTSIGDGAFSNCSGLTSVSIPNSVTNIGNSAFLLCSNLTKVAVPDSVESIGDAAFAWCSSLTDVIISNSVTSIGYSAFYSCGSLKRVTIPYSVTSIGDGAFSDCENLENIVVDSLNRNYQSIDGNLFNKSKTVLLQYASGKRDKKYQISDRVTNIGRLAFSGCNSLINVVIPSSVTNIGYGAFSDCESLENIIVDNENMNFRSIDGNLFNKANTTLIQYASGKRDKQYTIPDQVTNIGELAFSGCSSLTNIVIPNSVTSIGYCAFYSCSNLAYVTISDSVTYIEDGAFSGCTKLDKIYYKGTKDKEKSFKNRLNDIDDDNLGLADKVLLMCFFNNTIIKSASGYTINTHIINTDLINPKDKADSVVFFCGYRNDVLSKIETKKLSDFIDDKYSIKIDGNFSEIRVMLWKNLISAKPIILSDTVYTKNL